MHLNLQRFNSLNDKINEIVKQKQLKTFPQIVAVSKTFSLNDISPLIKNGHIHFGENKIQEAENKWSNLKKENSNLKLHMVGKLQSNKAKKAVQLFDYIHSLDNTKLAMKISKYEKELKKKIKLFIQVNIANDDQKAGIDLNNLSNFYLYCTNKLSLNIIGLMCLPPVDSNSSEYFQLLKKSANKLDLKELSMGMSDDYEQAISFGSTFLRLGTAIFGKRNI